VEVAGNSRLRRVDRQAREATDAGASSCPASIALSVAFVVGVSSYSFSPFYFSFASSILGALLKATTVVQIRNGNRLGELDVAT
jgi:hypothetical protein